MLNKNILCQLELLFFVVYVDSKQSSRQATVMTRHRPALTPKEVAILFE
jgi:hypothetical protein